MLGVLSGGRRPSASGLPETEDGVANPEPCLAGECRLSTSLTAEVLADDASLDAGFEWLCKHRQDWPADADVWAFRRDWPQEKVRMQQELRLGIYAVGLLFRVTLWRDGEPAEVDLWSARDAVVMKALAGLLQEASPGASTGSGTISALAEVSPAT